MDLPAEAGILEQKAGKNGSKEDAGGV